MRRELETPSPARLVIAMMWQSAAMDEPTALSSIEAAYGKTLAPTPAFDVCRYTPYYEPEMGPGLMKSFVEIEGLVPREKLVEMKIRAFDLESQHLDADKRQLNVDPMIVTPENIVISTSKNFTHRVYLGSGVFGDLALLFRNNTFERLAWTYPDYSDHIPFFNNVRARLLTELRRP